MHLPTWAGDTKIKNNKHTKMPEGASLPDARGKRAFKKMLRALCFDSFKNRIKSCVYTTHRELHADGWVPVNCITSCTYTTDRELHADGLVPVYALQIAVVTWAAQLVRSAVGSGLPVSPMNSPLTYIQVECSMPASAALAADASAMASPSDPV